MSSYLDHFILTLNDIPLSSVCVFCPPVTVKNTHSIPQNFLSALIYSRKLMLVMVSLGTQNLQQHTSLSIFQLMSKELAFIAIFQNAHLFTRPP